MAYKKRNNRFITVPTGELYKENYEVHNSKWLRNELVGPITHSCWIFVRTRVRQVVICNSSNFQALTTAHFKTLLAVDTDTSDSALIATFRGGSWFVVISWEVVALFFHFLILDRDDLFLALLVKLIIFHWYCFSKLKLCLQIGSHSCVAKSILRGEK